jgi:hypothetical protein
MADDFTSKRWTVTQLRRDLYEVSTRITSSSKNGDEVVELRVHFKGRADELPGSELWRKAVERAREIIAHALEPSR